MACLTPQASSNPPQVLAVSFPVLQFEVQTLLGAKPVHWLRLLDRPSFQANSCCSCTVSCSEALSVDSDWCLNRAFSQAASFDRHSPMSMCLELSKVWQCGQIVFSERRACPSLDHPAGSVSSLLLSCHVCLDAEATLTARYNDLDDVRKKFEEHKGQIAGVILEPVVGNSGYIEPQPGFLEGLREITRENDTLLCFDEVMTGFRWVFLLRAC